MSFEFRGRTLKFLKWILFSGYLFILTLSIILALIASAYAETGRARVLLTAIILGLASPVALLYRIATDSRRILCRNIFLSTLCSSVVLLGILFWTAPIEKTTGAATSTFLNGGAHSRLMNVVPEADAMNFGLRISNKIGLTFGEEDEQLRNLMLPLYREMEKDSEFRDLPSVLDLSVAELRNRPFDTGHVYQYVPQHRADERLPCIVFFHGYGGTAKTYFYLWHKLAEQHHVIVLCPTSGFGTYRTGAAELVERMRNYALQSLPVDPNRIYLAGYSNGGLPVSRALRADAYGYAGAILLSPVIEPPVADTHIEIKHKPPLLIFAGDKDDRIPVDYVRNNAAILQKGGFPITIETIPGEDHFMIYSSWNRISDSIGKWMNRP